MFESYGDVIRALLMGLLVAAIFVFASLLVLRSIVPKLERKLDPKAHRATHILLDGFKKPTRVWFRLAGVFCVLLTLLTLLPLDALPDTAYKILTALSPVLVKVLRITTVVCITWGLVSSSGLTNLVLHNKHLEIPMGKSVSRFLTAIFNVVIVVVAAGVVLSEFGYDINGLIAGIGIGGLTISLAAQKTASNFVGGLVLVLERPFEIGDWIVCGAVEGEVEDLNLRSTRVRTQEGSVTVIPNGTLADSNITNWTRHVTKRRVEFTLQVKAPDITEGKLQAFAKSVCLLLDADDDVVTGSAITRLTAISGTALTLTVLYDTDKTKYKDYLSVRQRLNLAVLGLARKEAIPLQ